MKTVTLISYLILSIALGLQAQQTLELNQMKFSVTLHEKEIEIQLEAPTQGWVGVGFNYQNSIVKSDLYLFHVIDNKVEGVDMHVVGFGNPKLDQEIGGTDDIRALQGKEVNGRTRVQFRLPWPTSDTYDYRHQLDKPFWLILAYSAHDDFNHHSRMREHVQFVLTEKN